MRRLCLFICLGILLSTAPISTFAAECCGSGGCTTCKPKWEDKKTKKPSYSMKCSDECVRGVDAWCDHGCCAEETSPFANVFTRKKLFKKDEDKVERVLKYELTQTPPACPPPCNACRPAWYDLRSLLCRCLGL